MDSKVVSKLAHELKDFISKDMSDDRSEFSQIKIFCSAHLHNVVSRKTGFFLVHPNVLRLSQMKLKTYLVLLF